MHTNLFRILCFSCQGKSRDIVYQRRCLFLWQNIRPARTFWNSTHCLLSPFTLDWYRNLWHNPMWNMAVNNISYPIYPLSTRTEKGYITKMIPFFFCSVYLLYMTTESDTTLVFYSIDKINVIEFQFLTDYWNEYLLSVPLKTFFHFNH